MPEGDTVHRVTRILGRELSGRVLDALELHDRGPLRELSGRRVEAVAAIAPHRTRLWVYGWAGKPCLDCGTPIVRFLQGDMGRSTWFCPSCQPQDPVPAAASGGTAAGVVEPGRFR